MPLQRTGVLKNETIDKTLANFTNKMPSKRGKERTKRDEASSSQKDKRVQTSDNEPVLLL